MDGQMYWWMDWMLTAIEYEESHPEKAIGLFIYLSICFKGCEQTPCLSIRNPSQQIDKQKLTIFPICWPVCRSEHRLKKYLSHECLSFPPTFFWYNFFGWQNSATHHIVSPKQQMHEPRIKCIAQKLGKIKCCLHLLHLTARILYNYLCTVKFL